MTHYYNKLGVFLKFDEETMIYEAIKRDETYVSYIRKVIPEFNKNLVISGFSERQDIPSTEEEFQAIKTQALNDLNN